MATKKKNVLRKRGSITWMDLQVMLRETKDLKVIKQLINEEKKQHNRGAWLLRIHQRYNQVRREQEQRKLLQEV